MPEEAPVITAKGLVGFDMGTSPYDPHPYELMVY
jgi:hypothetical protein